MPKEIKNYYFTYGVAGKSVGQDYDGGYTFVHAPDWNTAQMLWSAIHNPEQKYPYPYAMLYTEQDLKRKGWDEDRFGVCHDTIIYQDRKE